MSRFLAFLFALVFIVATPLVLLAFNLAQLATDREAFKQALQQTDLRQMAVDAAAATITNLAAQQGIGLDGISGTFIDNALDAAIPPEWVNEQANRVVDALFNYLDTGDPNALTLTIDTTPILERFRSQAGQQAIITTVQTLPPCPADQFPLDLATLTFTNCIPAGVDVAGAAAIIHQNLVALLDANPQLTAGASAITVNVLELSGTNPALLQQLQQLRQTLQRLQTGAWLLWLIPLGCLFFILVLAVRSPGDFGSWFGWPLLTAALLTLFLTFAIPSLYRDLLPTFLNPLIPPQADTILRPMLTAFVDIITQAWLFRVRIQAALVLIASIPLILIGLIWLVLYPRHDTLREA